MGFFLSTLRVHIGCRADFERDARAVPLSTLISASASPRPDASPNPPNPTLHQNRKRFFVVHGPSTLCHQTKIRY